MGSIGVLFDLDLSLRQSSAVLMPTALQAGWRGGVEHMVTAREVNGRNHRQIPQLHL